MGERLKSVKGVTGIMRQEPYLTAGLMLPLVATGILFSNELVAGRAISPREVVTTLAALEGFIGIPVGVGVQLFVETLEAYKKRSGLK